MDVRVPVAQARRDTHDDRRQLMLQRIIPHLWFDTEAEEAARFYTSIFENSGIVEVSHYPEGAPRPAGA